MDTALIIFDEMETFKNSGLGGFKALCDELEGKCGIVVAGMELREKWAKTPQSKKKTLRKYNVDLLCLGIRCLKLKILIIF
jgi:hypothetical protein